MDRCPNSTEMLHSMRRITLIRVAVRSHRWCETSSALASEGPWRMFARSSMQTMKGIVTYKHSQQLPRCPMPPPIEVCCPPLLTLEYAATLLRTVALPSELTLAYSSFSSYFPPQIGR